MPDPTIVYRETCPTSSSYNRLRRDAGWPPMDPVQAAHSLPISCFSISAYDGKELVGMGRVVGDFGLCFYIQDLVVAREFQGRGIGKEIMRRLMDFISEHAVENTYVGLMAAVGKEGFYHDFGFTSRPTETLGCGMTLFWSKGDSHANERVRGRAINGSAPGTPSRD